MNNTSAFLDLALNRQFFLSFLKSKVNFKVDVRPNSSRNLDGKVSFRSENGMKRRRGFIISYD